MSSNSSPPPRQYLHLKPLKLTQVPTHPLLKAHQSPSSPSLRTFITELLTEAIIFSDKTVSTRTQFKPKGGQKESKGSASWVQLLTWNGKGLQSDDSAYQPSKTAGPEHWFARQSNHEDSKEMGNANWEEFQDGLFMAHSPQEMEYTPDVYDAHHVLDWYEELLVLNDEGWGDNDWSSVAMEVYEMAHSIPFPLNNRVFPVLVVRALTNHNSLYNSNDAQGLPFRRHKYSQGFIVAQIPVDLADLPSSLYSSGRHRKDGDSAKKRANVTMGRYVSVERVKLTDSNTESGRLIRWTMATASDAGGNLPMGVQKMGVPGAVIKDVGLFIGWCRRFGPEV